MARGPYQGTWQQGVRPTVVHAPDALVFINGEPDILGCGECRRRFDWNRYITSIQVDLNVDSPPGSASINMSVPRHSVDDFYFDGIPLLSPMMEVEIFAKGFYLVEGLPQYYPIFWGLITDVGESYAAGEHTFSINCSDILKWWELCKMNINPAYTQATPQLGRSIFGNVLFGSNPYDMIWTLAQQAFGDVVIGTGSLISLYKENQQKSAFQSSLASIMLYWQDRFTKIRSNLLLYGTSGNAVRGDVLYEFYRASVGNSGPRGDETGVKKFASQQVRNANGGPDGGQTVFDPTEPQVTAFRTQFSQAGQVNFFQSEYQTKLEIANAAKEAIGFEFFMDVTGDIVFKPPFYNLDILSNKPVSWIQDIDIIDWDLTESEAEVVTQVQMQGAFGGNVDYGFPAEATPFTSATDYHLLRKYGWRTQTVNSEFMGSPHLMFYVGLDMLDRFNARRFRGTVNIPLRPELRLGFPIYLAPKDQMWYVNGISHNIQFGGRAQTTLSLTARRSKWVAPKGIGSITLTGYSGEKKKDKDKDTALGPPPGNLTSRQLQKGGQFKLDFTEAVQVPETNFRPAQPDGPYSPMVLRHPKTGRVVGFPNAVMAYTRPFQDISEADLKRIRGEKPANRKRVGNTQFKEANQQGGASLDAVAKRTGTATDDDRIREQYLTNRYSYGLNSAGVYTYLHDTGGHIQEMVILPADNLKLEGNEFQVPTVVKDKDGNESAGFKTVTKFPNSSGMIRPVSDARGFEVIGHWRYGRGVSLRDGALVVDELGENGGKNLRADIQTQVALTGSLLDTLIAQSTGLSTIQTGFKNPAQTIATLSPEDLQTAATFTPEGKPNDFQNVKTNFVDAAPLGSAEQKGLNQGVANVEASALSRALTLAEMSVREQAEARKECGCLLGRPDLAFINVGYQVQTLRATATDGTGISFGSFQGQGSQAAAGIVSAGQQLGVSFSQAELDQIEAAQLNPELIANLSSDQLDALTIAGAEADPDVVGATSKGNRPVADLALTIEQLTSTVESYLAGLYSALDASHQEFESAIRGDLLTKQNPTAVNPDQVRFGGLPDEGGFAPPFDTPGRARGGDPIAIARQAEQAIEDIQKEWNEFGDKLKSKAKRTQLQGEIDLLKKKISDLLNEKAELLNEFGGEGTGFGDDNQPLKASVTGSGGTVGNSARLEEIEKELAGDPPPGLQQQLAQKQQELNVLNQEFPC